MRSEKLYIGGEWVDPIDGRIVQSIDPSTGKEWATVAFGGAQDIDRAVEAARDAFNGPWRTMPGHERAALLRKFADLYKQKAEHLATLETRDNGRVIRESRLDVGSHHNCYHWFASLADKLSGQTIPIEDSVHVFTTRHPVGVVGAITPWNVPLMAAAWKLGPALASGCTVVLKPAEHTSITSLELAKLFEEAGFPPGVVNVVPGEGAVAGHRLAEHPDVAKVTFTGEGGTAKKIMQAGADTSKKYSFELGGKAPNIIFADADLEQALNGATSSSWALCGQSCALGSRVLVEESIYDSVVDAFVERAAKVRVGMPLDDATHMGPQAHLDQFNKTLSYIEIGQQEGAELVAGGQRLSGGELGSGEGYFVAPTVFANASNDMRIAQEEIFGPVVCLIPFSGEEQAVSIANGTQYGLAAGLWTSDVGRAHRVSSKIDAGIVWVNTYRYIRWSTPYGGFKASGWGRENGVEALNEFLQTKTTVISKQGQFPDAYGQ